MNMRKSIIIFIFILLLSSCSTTSKLNINNELPGYEYLITNREGYNTTYSFYGNKANTIFALTRAGNILQYMFQIT